MELDADDFVHIRGRVKRFAKIAGEMISLEVVERIAAAAAPTFQHAASTRSDAAKGEALVLFTTGPVPTRDQLIAAARQLGAPELAVPKILRRLEEIPLLGTGKTDYVQLKKLAEASAANTGGVELDAVNRSLSHETAMDPRLGRRARRAVSVCDGGQRSAVRRAGAAAT